MPFYFAADCAVVSIFFNNYTKGAYAYFWDAKLGCKTEIEDLFEINHKSSLCHEFQTLPACENI